MGVACEHRSSVSVTNGLNIGKQQIHPHGHGWPVTTNLEEWSWDNSTK